MVHFWGIRMSPFLSRTCLFMFLLSMYVPQVFAQNDDEPFSFDGRIAGVVLDENEKPIPNAMMVAEDFSVSGDFSSRSILRGRTDSEGRFELGEKFEVNKNQRREYWLFAYAPGFDVKCVKPQASPKGPLDCRMQLRKESTITVTVVGNDNIPIEGIDCFPGYFEFPNGVYESDSSTGLIAWVPKDLANALRVKTDASGEATLKGLPGALLRSVELSREGVLPQRHSIRRNNLILTLENTGTVTGSVVSFENIPIEGRKIHLSSEHNAVEAYYVCTLDKNGEFRAEGFLVGKVSASLEWPSHLPKQPFHIGPQTLKTGDEIDFTIELVDTVKITGKLVAQDTGEGIPFAQVLINEEEAPNGAQATFWGNHYTIETDQEGHFVGFVIPGKYGVQAINMTKWKKASEYAYPKSIRLECRSTDGEKDLENLEAVPLARASGRVEDAKGNPVAHRWVAFVTNSLGHAEKTGKTDEKGEFSYVVRPHNLNIGEGKWVVYPEGLKSGALDGRQLPAARVASESPLELIYEPME